jgi:hypothetical protein
MIHTGSYGLAWLRQRKPRRARALSVTRRVSARRRIAWTAFLPGRGLRRGKERFRMLINAELRWPVPSEGFTVRGLSPGAVGRPISGAERPRAGKYLIPAAERKDALEFADSRPLAKRHLYVEFARLPLRSDAIEEFANRHGLLGRPVSATALIGGRLVECEAINLWYEEIAALSETFRLWERLYGGHPINWQLIGSLGQTEALLDEVARRHLPHGTRSRASVALDRHVRKAIDAGNSSTLSQCPPAVLAQAIPAAYRVVQQYLRSDSVAKTNRISEPRLFAAGHIADKITAYMRALVPQRYRWNRSQGRFEVTMEPTTLLGAIWAQFAQSVSANRFRKCTMCGAFFEVSVSSESGSRIDRKHCSVKCKQQAYRRRTAKRRTGSGA